MNVVVLADHESACRFAADALCASVAWKPHAQLGLATGATPVRSYELIAERVRAGEASFARARLVKLVEWAGASADDPTSFERYLRDHVLGPFGIAADRYVGFRGDAADPPAECARVREHLAASGGLDLCLLGLGVNGHIGLNEPGEFLAQGAHLADLAESTRARFDDGDEPPGRGFTLGVGELLLSREIVLLATGEAKADGVRRLMEGEITTSFPASLLWTHRRAIAVFDRAAASLVRRKSLFGA